MPNERYQRIKEKVGAAQVAEDHGLQLQADGQGREKALCPFHDDHDPSLKLFADGGYKCFACDASGDAVSLEQTLGGHGSASEAASAIEERHYLADADEGLASVSSIRRPRKPEAAPKTKSNSEKKQKKQNPKRVGETARWTIRDEDGEARAMHIRYKTRDEDGEEDKDYSYRLPDGSWEPGAIKAHDLPLYLSESVSDYDPAEPVVLVEGEKAADAAAEAGLQVVATTAGTNVMPDTKYLEVLRGYTVVLWPDNDDPGRKHMAEMAEVLGDIAAEVRWFLWEEAPEKGDAADHPAVTGGELEVLDDLWEALREAPAYNPGRHKPEAKKKATSGQAKPGGGSPGSGSPGGGGSAGSSSSAGRARRHTDYGNAERLVDRHGQDLLYLYAWSKWLVWDGRRWALDTTGEVERRAKETVRSIYAEAANAPDEEMRKAIAKHAQLSESRGSTTAMIAHARSEPDIPIEVENLDTDNYLLNAANGTIDLRTGDLHAHNRSNLISKLAPVEYDLQAQAPVWEAFLEEILPSPEVRGYLQRLVGYALTGTIGEHILPIFHGVGANGKSTLLNTVLVMMGDYGLQAAGDLLVAKKEAHPTEQADLFGRRLVTNMETEDGKRFAESRVKQLTGGDRVRARRMREDFWEFLPTHTLFLATNHKPEVRGTDHAIWRRLRLIPFSVTIPPEMQDKHLEEKLRTELPGILRWAVEGCLAWQRDGLGEPAEVMAATADYRDEMNPLSSWLAECCVEAPGAWSKLADLYQSYYDWCDAAHEHAVTKRSFSQRLTDRGYEADKGTGNVAIRRGIGLSSNDNYTSEGLETPDSDNGVTQGPALSNPENPCTEAENETLVTQRYSESGLNRAWLSHEAGTWNRDNWDNLSNSGANNGSTSEADEADKTSDPQDVKATDETREADIDEALEDLDNPSGEAPEEDASGSESSGGNEEAVAKFNAMVEQRRRELGIEKEGE